MKDLLQKGALFAVLGIVVIGGGLLFAIMVLVMGVTAVSNLAIWPMMVAVALGLPVSGPWIIGIAVAMAVAIFVYGPSISRKTEDQIGAVMSLGCMGTVLSFFLGFPLWFVLVQLNGGQLTGWAIIPCGIFTASLVWAWMMSRNKAG